MRLRIPYVVGRWVRGEQHYGRQRLIFYLLAAPDNAYWVVGTRRIGKTSLLRELERLTDEAASRYVPLVWDMQGSDSPAQLADELFYAVEDARDRWARYDVDVDALNGQDAVAILRTLQRAVAGHDAQLLLLIDEAEVLISIGADDSNWLARLRKIFQSERQRTVIASTKLLAKLNDLQSEWMTSPFLFGFNMVNLWSLDQDSAVALVRQTQGDLPVLAEDELVTQILDYTNCHPYLMQYLCQRIYMSTDESSGTLRPITDVDLLSDQLLSGFFRIDFQHLTRLERSILLAVADLRVATEREILARLTSEPASRVRTFLYGLHKLGYIRELDGKWLVGNEFMRGWLRDNAQDLAVEESAPVSDRRMEEMLERGVNQELSFLQKETAFLQAELERLFRSEAAADDQGARALQPEIARVRHELTIAQRNLRIVTSALTQRP